MDLVLRAERHPGPGETVQGADFHTYPGGKGANQALAAARLGAEVRMVGKVGADAFGDELIASLVAGGVGVGGVARTENASTGIALVVVATTSGENTIVVVPGANALLTADDVDSVPLGKGDVVLSQFEVPLDPIERLFRRAREVGATTILNPSPARHCSLDLLALADVLIVNETELRFLLDEPSGGQPSHDTARRLRVSNKQVVVVTLGRAGAIAVAPAGDISVSGRPVTVVDTTGAGDTFAGAMAARWGEGTPLDGCLKYANAAAAICVQRLGAGPSIPTAAEVIASL